MLLSVYVGMFSFNLTQIEFTLRYSTFYNLSIFFVRPSAQSVWVFYNFFLAHKTVSVMI